MHTATLDPGMSPPGAWRWWEARRLRYNVGLAVVGWAAWGLWMLQVLAVNGIEAGFGFRPSLGLTITQGIVYLLFMAAANVCFLAGPVSETVLRPDDPQAYRRRMFGLGFWFSMALPFVMPALMLPRVLFALGL